MEWTSPNLVAAAVAVLLAVVAGLSWKPFRTRLKAREVRRGVALFRLQREQLEAKFFDLARIQGKPRGLRWLDCEWHSRTTFARDRHSGLLTAFVAVDISFEAVKGGDMEDVEAVGTIREAAAVFHYRHGRWGTGGRPLFNMNPEDAVIRLRGQFEPVSVDGATM